MRIHKPISMTEQDISKWLLKLEKIEALSKGGRMARLLNQPLKYLNGTLLSQLQYRLTKKGKFAVANTFFGRPMDVILPAGMDLYLIGAKSHGSELRLTKYLVRHLREGDIFLDIGAHFGYYSLLASSLVGSKGRVIGIEASPSIYQVLKKNTNHVKHIDIFNIAATENEKLISFYEFPIRYSEYNTIYAKQYEKTLWFKRNLPTAVKVKGKRMDSHLKRLRIIPKIVKIDVEGAEYDVVRGLDKLIEAHIPTIISEYLIGNRSSANHKKAAEFLISKKYQANLIKQDGTLKVIEGSIEGSLGTMNIESDNIVFKTKKISPKDNN